MQAQLQQKDSELSERVQELEEQLHITRKKKDESEIKIKQYEKSLEYIRNPNQERDPLHQPK